MPTDPIIRKTIDLPYNYTFSIQATPWTIRRTFFMLLPWAIVAMAPGRISKVTKAIAAKVSPLIKQDFR